MRLIKVLLTRQSAFTIRTLLLSAWLSIVMTSVAGAYDETKYHVEIEPKRWALVIGNKSYKSMAEVQSSKVDGEEMRSRLTQLNFTVDYYPDVKTADDFEACVRQFREKVSPGDWVIIYFSGHGFSYGGSNYLVPTEMSIPIKRDEITLQAITVDGLIDAVAKREPGIIMLFIDACRSVGNIIADDATGGPPPVSGLKADIAEPRYEKVSHPIFYSRASGRVAEGVSVTGGVVGAGRGLEELVEGHSKPKRLLRKVNYIIFYPTDPGEVSEGFSADRLSTFTNSLVNWIGTAGQPFLGVFRRIMAEVSENTGERQNPNVYLFSKTDPYFLPTEQHLKDERESWHSILRKRDYTAISTFLYLNSVSLHAVACRLWLNDAQAATYTKVSPAAVERAWEAANEKRVGILRMEGAPLVFERQLEQSQGLELDKLSNAELGVVTTETEGAGQLTYLAGNVKTTSRVLDFYLKSLDDHKTVVATRDLIGLKSRHDDGDSQRIPAGSVLEILDVTRVSATLGYVRATIRGETSTLFIKVQAPEVLLNTLGKPLKEIMVPPRPDSIPYLVDPTPIREALAELKNQGWDVTWYSLSTAALAPTDKEEEQDARLLRLANAEYILKNEGVEGVRITSVSGKDDFSGNDVRVRFFGVKKN